MSKFGIIREFWNFLKEGKMWWITPIILLLLLLGAILVFGAGSPLAPFIYSLF